MGSLRSSASVQYVFCRSCSTCSCIPHVDVFVGRKVISLFYSSSILKVSSILPISDELYTCPHVVNLFIPNNAFYLMIYFDVNINAGAFFWFENICYIFPTFLTLILLFLYMHVYSLFFLIFEFYFIFLYSRFLLVIHLMYINVYMSIPISQFITPPPPPPRRFSPLVSICLFSTSLSLFLLCKLVHLYHFSSSTYMR